MKFSDLLQLRKQELNLSLEEIASNLTSHGYEVTKSAVGYWSTGERSPKLGQKKVRDAIAAVLQIDVNEMMNMLGFTISEDDRSPEARQVADIVDRMPDDERRRILAVVRAYEESRHAHNGG